MSDTLEWHVGPHMYLSNTSTTEPEFCSFTEIFGKKILKLHNYEDSCTDRKQLF